MQKLSLLICLLLFPLTMWGDDNESTLWGDINYDGEPWVKNISQPVDVTRGLQGRHISLWASHGHYFDQNKGAWKWQRPNLFGTTEDLFTQTIVVPYLIPMLENAGANVFTPRERDWQKQEVIVDNDGSKRNYIEVTSKMKWQTSPQAGFMMRPGAYSDGENPFMAGSARMVKTTSSKSRYSLATYQPDFKRSGRYAVYVSYQTMPNSVDDVLYTVWHKGERTQFHVNQQMGGSTWVYLGTFDFDAGYSEFNKVTVSNLSRHKGVVTTDAVRFGGGMGNIQRLGRLSGMPRALEGARYYAQWAGMPYEVYSSKNGQNDYADDINVRSLMTNLLAGGSCYMPNTEGRKVPIELSLAVHSDAGYHEDGSSIHGPLAICTTDFNEGKLDAGISRQASYNLARDLLYNEVADIQAKYGQWTHREIRDRNYSETRLPGVPSAILEILSHQSFPDMRYGQDPGFKFTLARSIYKTLLRYINQMHDTPYMVTPLAPDNFRIDFIDDDEIRLSWDAVEDPQEPTARPAGYILYTAMGDADFDNGTYIHGDRHFKMELIPGLLYHFKVVAVNRGGKSFPTEVLSALYNPEATRTVMIVNGFHRVSSPAIRNNGLHQGFDLDEDPGVSYGPTLGWLGRQINFDRTQMGDINGGLGDSSDELAGYLIAGNDFNYVKTHAEAIQAGRYNIVSCSSKAVQEGQVKLEKYDVVDLLLGLERNDGHSLDYYKTFTPAMQQVLKNYTTRGGRLLVSGAYTASDMLTEQERFFMASTLRCRYLGRSQAPNNLVNGLGTKIYFYKNLNEEHYAATSTDMLQPVKPAITAMQYSDGYGAAIAYKNTDCSLFVMGFPFECIKTSQKRASIMQGILNYLIQ